MSDKLTDKLVGDGVKPELSPNPNGSGYTKQVEVDSLLSIANPEVNVLYICQGRKYKYAHAIIDPGTDKTLVPAGFVRVENGPQVHNVDGGRGTPVHKNVAPQVPPRVFNEPVALNGGVTIKGKQLEDLISESSGSVLPDMSGSGEGDVLMTDGEDAYWGTIEVGLFVHNIVIEPEPNEGEQGDVVTLTILTNEEMNYAFTFENLKRFLIENNFVKTNTESMSLQKKCLVCQNISFSSGVNYCRLICEVDSNAQSNPGSAVLKTYNAGFILSQQNGEVIDETICTLTDNIYFVSGRQVV